VASGGTLEGRVLWPGASVGADGRGDGWPGWENVAGEWVETTGNFAWTRGAVSATIQVNPTLPLSLSYPPSTPACRTAPAGTTPIVAAADVAGALPATGGSSQFLIPVTVGALGVVLVGTVLIVRRRQSRA